MTKTITLTDDQKDLLIEGLDDLIDICNSALSMVDDENKDDVCDQILTYQAIKDLLTS